MAAKRTFGREFKVKAVKLVVIRGVLPGVAQHQPKMDDVHSGLDGGPDSLYYPVRRPDEQSLNPKPVYTKLRTRSVYAT